MSDLFWLSDPQMARFEPLFPNSYGKPCWLTVGYCVAKSLSNPVPRKLP